VLDAVCLELQLWFCNASWVRDASRVSALTTAILCESLFIAFIPINQACPGLSALDACSTEHTHSDDLKDHVRVRATMRPYIEGSTAIEGSVSALPTLASRTTVSLPQPISGYGPATYTVPGPFPTSLYESYYDDPTGTIAEPQPVISDPVTDEIYPYWLTNPETIPQNNTHEAHPLPPPATSSILLETALAQIKSIAANPVFRNDTCTRCQASLEVAKFMIMAAPQEAPSLLVQLCAYFNYDTDENCATTYGISTLASPIAQMLAYADAGGLDGQV